jgi:nucleoside-diphosphate-sugar epimerase
MNQSGNNTVLHEVKTSEEKTSVLIAGDNGFIGSYLSEKLLELPVEIFFISPSQLDELQHLKENENFSFQTQENVTSIIQNLSIKPDYIFHLVDNSLSKSHFKNNFELTDKLLNFAKECNAKYQLVSQENLPSEVNSKENKKTELSIETNEQDKTNIDEIRNFINSKAEKYSLNYRIIRLIDVYGPKMSLKENSELSQLLNSFIDNRPLTVVGEGLVPLFPLYIKDAVTATVRAMLTESSQSRTLVIAGSQEITTLNLTYKLREILLREERSLFEIEFIKKPDDSSPKDHFRKRLELKTEINKSQNFLHWQPRVELIDGLIETIKWLKQTKKKQKKNKKDIFPLQSKKRESKNKDSPKIDEHHPSSRQPISSFQPIEASFVKSPNQTINKKNSVSRRFFGSWRNRTKGEIKAKRFMKIISLVILGLVIMPIIIFISIVGFASFRLYQSINFLKSGDFKPAEQSAQSAYLSFKLAKTQFRYFPNSLFELILRTDTQNVDNLFDYAKHASSALKHASRSAIYASEIKDVILGDSQLNITDNLAKLRVELHGAYSSLAQLESVSPRDLSVNSFGVLSGVHQKIFAAKNSISQYRSTIEKSLNLMEIFTDTFAVNDKKSYLILLQNNAELRPTGGFIGSLATISFDDAKLSELKVDDVYALDGQLKGHVEPPTEIKKYLGEAGWYLRDANWDPDFPTSSRQIEWFFEKETKRKVDGVIALNLYVVKEILENLGPVTLEDYESTITSENLFRISEYYSEVNSFPGSTQKKDFLGSLTASLMSQMKNADSQVLFEVVQSLYESLEKGQLLVFLHDQHSQEVLSEYGWDGSLKNVSCTGSITDALCRKTYISVREANIGVNKANYFIDRFIDLRQDLDEKSLVTTINLTYHNRSQGSKWPGGTYKNYMRVYLNNEVKVMSVKLDGKEINTSQLSIKSEHGKQIIGFLTETPPQKEKKVQIIVSSTKKLFNNGKLESVLYVQKQPGTEDDPISITISKSDNLKLDKANLPLEYSNNNQLNISRRFSKDINLIIDFSRLQ